MDKDKTKTLINDILALCEDQGLTEEEVNRLPLLLKKRVIEILSQKTKTNKFHR